MLRRRLPTLTRKHSWILLVLVLVVSALFGPITHATTPLEALGNTVGNAIFLILSNVVLIMIRLFASLTGVLTSLLVIVARYNTFLNAPIVQQGWPIVRDLMNMVFIIGLLMISAGTVLRLQNYQYNRLLGKLIIMAFLVNFSKFIAVFLLQFAQVVMLTFVNAFRDAAFGKFSHMFGLDAVLNFANQKFFSIAGATSAPTGSASVLITLIAGLVMMLVAFVVMLAITVVLFVRIVALWLLIILSPLAYALKVIPQTEHYAGEWWKEFAKYAVVGPVLAFFLWIALALVGNGNCGGTNVNCNNPLAADQKVSDAQAQGEADTATLRQDLLSEALTLDRLITFIVGIIFLMMGLQYAQKSGTAGAAFAGKVAAAGFGAAATLSGLNFVRDRTVAPVQGWIKNRQRARGFAVQQRTETLEAFGDRARAAMPVAEVRIPGTKTRIGLTRAGQERAAAGAAGYEGRRTPELGKGQGYSNMKDDALLAKMVDTTQGTRERLAAMATLQGRGPGHLDLADPGALAAFTQLTSARGGRGANTYMPEADRKKTREEALKSSAQYMSHDQVRQLSGAAETPEERLILEQALESKKRSQAIDPADVARLSALRAGLRDNPGGLKEYDDGLKKSNPEMAKKVIFNDLQTADDRQNLLLAVQQKQMSASALNQEAQEKFAAAGESGAIAHYLIDNSPDEETLRGYYRAMDPEAAKSIFSHVKMGAGASVEQRAMVAKVTGEMGKAFTDATNTYMENEAKTYADKLGGDELAKNISVESLKSNKVLATLNNSDNMKFPHWETIRNRNKETRTALTEGLGKYADQLAASSPDGKMDLDPKNEENNFVVQNLALASKGKDLRMDLSSASGQRAYEGLVRGGKAADLAKLHESDLYKNPENRKYMLETYGMVADPAKIADMLQFENYDWAVDGMSAGEAELEKRLQKKGGMKAFSRLDRMAKHPVLSAYIATPEKPDKQSSASAAKKSAPDSTT